MLRRHCTRTDPATPDVHVFLLWPLAAAHADRILADIKRRFSVHEIIRVRWTPERFAENLGRFYGPLLPPDIDKLGETGTGDLIVVIIIDPRPRYRRRRRTLGRVRVNANVFDAKQRYRGWTGGGHLVHATNDAEEAARDLFLLFGRTIESVAPMASRARPPLQLFASDLIGADGWSSFEELLTAMRLCGGYVLLNLDAPPQLLTHAAWAAEILKARRVGDGPLYDVLIAGAAVPMVVSWIGDGHLPTVWQEAILRDAIRTPSGLLVPSPRDRLYLLLHRMLEDDAPLPADQASALQGMAEACGAPAGDYGNTAFVRTALDAFVAGLEPS